MFDIDVKDVIMCISEIMNEMSSESVVKGNEKMIHIVIPKRKK